MEKNNELSQINKLYFKRQLNLKFARTFDIIIFTLLGLTQPIHFLKKTIVQELQAQFFLICYYLDYPINVASNFNNIQTPQAQSFALKKNPKKHIVGE